MKRKIALIWAGCIAAFAALVWLLSDETDDDRAERDDRPPVAPEILATHRYAIPWTGLVNPGPGPDDSLFCAPRRPGPTCGGA